jgi:hypothetical protein
MALGMAVYYTHQNIAELWNAMTCLLIATVLG